MARELLATNPDTSALFYADPDITFIAPWKFFEEWVSCGVALCADSNFPRVSLNHPWRCKWAELIAAAGLEVTNRLEDYPNSGFFGIRRQDGAFLDRWIDLTEALDPISHKYGERANAKEETRAPSFCPNGPRA